MGIVLNSLRIEYYFFIKIINKDKINNRLVKSKKVISKSFFFITSLLSFQKEDKYSYIKYSLKPNITYDFHNCEQQKIVLNNKKLWYNEIVKDIDIKKGILNFRMLSTYPKVCKYLIHHELSTIFLLKLSIKIKSITDQLRVKR